MKSFLRGVLVLTIALSWFSHLHSAIAQVDQIDLKALAKKSRPAVMLLVVSDDSGKEIATGTGFLVSTDGKLITNFHVIEKAKTMVAKAENGGIFPVEGVLSADPKNDLVMLKLKGKDLPYLTLGDSEKIEIGSRVAVIGSPLGLEGSVSDGIVSAIRDLMGDVRRLQITAAISAGSSGSPVLNTKGEVIGVASELLKGGQSLNFAVPAEAVRALMAKGEKTPVVQPFGEQVASDDDKIFADPDWLAAEKAEAAQDYVEVLKRAQTLVRHYPENASAHFCLGVAYGKLKFHDDAIAAYKQAIKLEPDYASAWYNLGVCYGKAGRTDDAIVAYKQAIKLKPDDAEAWYNLGVNYGKTGRTDDEIAAYKQTIKLKPDYAKAWYNLGVRYGKAGRTKDSEDAFQRARRLNPALFK